MQNNYSNADYLNLFYIHAECNRIISRTCRRFNELNPNVPPMNAKKFRRIEANFLEFGTFKATKINPSPVTGNENNEITVLAYFEAYPQASIYTAVHDVGIPYTSIERILWKNKMHNYKFITVQAMHPEDPVNRAQLCETILIRSQEDNDFLKKIIWTDESKFSREGIFNRRNHHIWANENPHAIRERGFQQTFSFNVFCLLKDNKLCYHIYDGTLTSQRYMEILRTIVSDFLDDLPLQEYGRCWYQLDGAPPHCTREVSNVLDDMFEDRWIRRRGPWLWPARSPDLTPLDFYLWGKMKSKVYDTPVNTRDELEIKVRRAFEELDANEIRRATTGGVMTRILNCLHVNGQHIEQLLV